MVQDLIVLGIIPGTNIQINFQLWLFGMIVALSVWQHRRIIQSKILAAALLYLTFRTRRVALDAITI